MKKETIELTRTKNFPQGYGRMDYYYPHKDSPEVLNKIVDWSQDKNVSVYSHRVYSVEENVGDSVYAHFIDGKKVTEEEYILQNRSKDRKAYFVRYCELVDYLEIYYQEK